MLTPSPRTLRWATNLLPFSPSPDRYVRAGYRAVTTIEQRIEQARQIEGLSGVELHYPAMFEELGVEGMRALLERTGLACAMVTPDMSGEKKWRLGSLTHPDAELRSEAVQRVRETMQVARDMGAHQINLWLGQDGFEYPFQTDYGQAWEWLCSAVSQCAAEQPDVRICIEAKPKEPRAFSLIESTARALLLIREVNLPNVGANLDVGHVIMARENPARAAVTLSREGRLFHLHFNDTYGDWDWDLVAGAVHPIHFLELLFWLNRLGYQGWYSLDEFHPREDPVAACSQSIANMNRFAALLVEFPTDELMAALAKDDAVTAQKLVFDRLFRSSPR